MAKKTRPGPAVQPEKMRQAQRQPVIGATGKPSANLLIMAGIAVLTWLALGACVNNQFSWDDAEYIQNNTLLHSLTLTGLKSIFSSPVMGNYHPLTILSFALEYHFAELDPWLYHFDNLALHIINTMLVYWLVMSLSKRPVAGIVAAILFGIHPMHIESVAWASGRKDVLYTFFYLWACITHLSCLRGNRKGMAYTATLILFVCALLAKPMAVTLPLTLLLIDYFEKRTWARQVFLEKLPHLALALLFGIIALRVQHSAGAMDMQRVRYGFADQLVIGCYALITYLWKAVIPAHLSNLYSYPAKVNGGLPGVFYVYPALVAALGFVVWRFLRRNHVVVFGLLFFLVNVALVLQFLPVGDAVIAERYTYVPYIGLFFIAGWYVPDISANRFFGRPALAIAAVYACALFYVANERCKVWYDANSLWRDEISKDPYASPGAYDNLGFYYYQKCAGNPEPAARKSNFDSAAYFLNKAIEIWPTYVNPYLVLGEMQRYAKDYDDAKQTYFRAMKLIKDNPNLTLGLAIIYFSTKNNDSANYWFRYATIIHPSPESFGNYGNFLSLTGSPDSAIVQYGNAINQAPGQYGFYINRADLYLAKNMPGEALKDYNKALELNPDAGGAVFYNRSRCYEKKGMRQQALSDLDKAVSLGYDKVSHGYYDSLHHQ